MTRAYIAFGNVECWRRHNIEGVTHYYMALCHANFNPKNTKSIENIKRLAQDKRIYIKNDLNDVQNLDDLTIDSIIAITLFFPELANQYIR